MIHDQSNRSSKPFITINCALLDNKNFDRTFFGNFDSTKKDQEYSCWIMESDKTEKIQSINNIPLGHKIALKDFKEGDTILKYGHDIGKVVVSIKKGDHVHVHNVKTKKW